MSGTASLRIRPIGKEISSVLLPFQLEEAHKQLVCISAVRYYSTPKDMKIISLSTWLCRTPCSGPQPSTGA